MTVKIFIRNLKSKIHYFDKYIVFIFYIKNVLFDDKNIYIFIQIIREIYIIDDFKIDIFIETNIFTSE